VIVATLIISGLTIVIFGVQVYLARRWGQWPFKPR
jgi:hypothetical protein